MLEIIHVQPIECSTSEKSDQPYEHKLSDSETVTDLITFHFCGTPRWWSVLISEAVEKMKPGCDPYLRQHE